MSGTEVGAPRTGDFCLWDFPVSEFLGRDINVEDTYTNPAHVGLYIRAYETAPGLENTWFSRSKDQLQRAAVEDSGIFGTHEQINFRHEVTLKLMHKLELRWERGEGEPSRVAVVPYKTVGAGALKRPVFMMMVQPMESYGQDEPPSFTPSVSPSKYYRTVLTNQYDRMLYAAYKCACDNGGIACLEFGILGQGALARDLDPAIAKVASIQALYSAVERMPRDFFDRVKLRGCYPEPVDPETVKSLDEKAKAETDQKMLDEAISDIRNVRAGAEHTERPAIDPYTFVAYPETYSAAVSEAYVERRGAWYAPWRKKSMHHGAFAAGLTNTGEGSSYSAPDKLEENLRKEMGADGRKPNINPKGHSQVVYDVADCFLACEGPAPVGIDDMVRQNADPATAVVAGAGAASAPVAVAAPVDTGAGIGVLASLLSAAPAPVDTATSPTSVVDPKRLPLPLSPGSASGSDSASTEKFEDARAISGNTPLPGGAFALLTAATEDLDVANRVGDMDQEVDFRALELQANTRRLDEALDKHYG